MLPDSLRYRDWLNILFLMHFAFKNSVSLNVPGKATCGNPCNAGIGKPKRIKTCMCSSVVHGSNVQNVFIYSYLESRVVVGLWMYIHLKTQ